MALGVASAPLRAATVAPGSIAWQPTTIDVRGPWLEETGTAPNPFLDVRLDVTLTAPSGRELRVPGFFAGDGAGGGTGDVWRARFAPDEDGEWRYRIDFVTATDVAVADPAEAAAAAPLDGHGDGATFEVAPPDPDAPGYLGRGRLDYVGEHYLRHLNGEWWIKGGVDSPENFFGYAGFDNTLDQPGGPSTAGLVDGLHRYAPHVGDWREGDPLFASADTGVDSRGIVGAINYLADQGVNSLYFLPMNLGGDGRETYPFVGPSGSVFDDTHYDVSKLHQWNAVLAHMQRRGVAAHVVLGEREIGNTEWLDGGELGRERKLFYREMVARFAYLNALKWNLSEESRFDAAHHRAFARHLRSLDWAAHPIAVHTVPDAPWLAYNELLGDTDFDASSIQFSPKNADAFVELWRTRSREAGWPWVLDMDEVGPAGVGLTDTNADELRGSVLYPVYFGGGNLEWYFGYHALPLGGDMRTEDFRTREPMYRYMRHARRFMLEHLPFVTMSPADELLDGAGDDAQVLAEAGEVYALYLPNGGDAARLAVPDGEYRWRWFDPRDGLFVGETRRAPGAGGTIALGAPPEPREADWVVLVESAARSDGDASPGAPEPEDGADDANDAGGGEAPLSVETEVPSGAGRPGEPDGDDGSDPDGGEAAAPEPGADGQAATDTPPAAPEPTSPPEPSAPVAVPAPGDTDPGEAVDAGGGPNPALGAAESSTPAPDTDVGTSAARSGGGAFGTVLALALLGATIGRARRRSSFRPVRSSPRETS